MDLRTRIMAYVVVFTLFYLITGNPFKDKSICYSVEIEFTDGTKRTVQFESIDPPKVIKNGCLYDYSKKSWICGVRDMSYKICSK